MFHKDHNYKPGNSLLFLNVKMNFTDYILVGTLIYRIGFCSSVRHSVARKNLQVLCELDSFESLSFYWETFME